ncbi:HEAT repeat domain-containing protein [Nodularia spumigena]|uniref:HEAT repeat domain-containing protein n=1 Tax=Nodularia spumigena TaxID=70799 RepID=UPI00232E4DCF|nr:HEAT repeat domain-containing protein [Nodularia spumigena]MDB9319587.1 HEAT repeat domain-containing protein [Nodularia spumigena CS-590/01A]MDB9328604.1 HEAT repeat domain-containing protein [Nodularia spumigena CS-590/02]MDB9335876.1 HEAT repeat domain-containing protein [Nodularia spumigena CS-590/01]MDB9349784.1 HEAT repeat domain-containing protein [Nodularia spumigena CS-588/01]MDB9352900.1 HEAT repeat domain-containing protein [Nodularia spumigena CS-588/05]
MVNNINQLLAEAQAASDAADWSLLTQYLQQLTLTVDSTHPEIVKHRQYLLELALSILEMGDFQQRWDIAKVLKQLGNIAIPRLIDILEDEYAEEDLRWYAVRTLGEFQHPEAIVSLVDLLKTSENEELKTMAASALGQMGSLAITALTELLAAEETRLLAVRSLAYIRTQETITPLLSVVEDAQPAVRSATLEALSSFHDQRLPPVLLNALDDVAATVRRAAVQGLGFRPDLSKELDLVTRLQPRLYDFNLEVCCATAIALSRMGTDEAAQYLFEALISPNTPLKLQLEVIRALIWVETLSGLAYLQQALYQTTSEALWQEIITVLGQVQKPELMTSAAEILLDVLDSQHLVTVQNPFRAKIKSAIALGLGQLGNKQAVEPLILLLSDANQIVKLNVIAALKKLNGEFAYQQLQQLGNSSTLTPDLQQGIAIALAEW